MTYYKIKELTIWEVNKNISLLNENKKLFVTYFNNVKNSNLNYPTENHIAKSQREKINFNLVKLIQVIRRAYILTDIQYTPPPVTRGHTSSIDIFSNFFNLYRFDVDPQIVIDKINQAIGVYNDEKSSAILRTYNPLWWFGKLIQSIAYIPFWLLQSAGINTSKFEKSIIGRLLKLIFDLVIFFASLLAILSAFGWQEFVVNLIKQK